MINIKVNFVHVIRKELLVALMVAHLPVLPPCDISGSIFLCYSESSVTIFPFNYFQSQMVSLLRKITE